MNYQKHFSVFSIFLFLCSGVYPSEIRLPHVTTIVNSGHSNSEVFLGEDDISCFSSIEEALESTGVALKDSNNEITFHGYWNSSIKVYVNGILMNDPNTGKFDFSSLDVKTVRSIKIDPVSSNGGVHIYITTFHADYTKQHYSAGFESKSYFSSSDAELNDSFKLFASVGVPFIFRNGSALYFQDSVMGKTENNHFGYLSTDSSYNPDFQDSYKKWLYKKSGWENRLLNNSFSVLFSSSKLPGASIGFNNYISLKKGDVGTTKGAYAVKKEEEDTSIVFAVPLNLPFRNFKIRLQPSIKISGIDYSEKDTFSGLNDEYNTQNYSLQGEIGIRKIFDVDFLFSEDTAVQKSAFSSGQTEEEHNFLFTAFVVPKTAFGFMGNTFTFSVPVSYFAPANRFDLLFSAKVEREFFTEKSDLSAHLFFSASRNVTTPVFQQLYYSGSGGKGNPDLKTESALSFYAGLTIRDLFELSFKPFLIFYEDKIAWNSDSFGNWTPVNAGSSINNGFDFIFDTGSLWDFARLKSSYTLCRAYLTTDSTVMGKQIMYTPVHSLALSLEVPAPNGFLLSATYRFTSEKYTDNINLYSVPSSHILSSRASWTYRNMELYVLWENMLDFKYVPVSGYPEPGTSITLGGNYTF